jgi:hypothetical protein
MSRTAKPSRCDRSRRMIAGVKKHYANAPSIVVDGVSYAPAEIERIFQDSIDSADATSSATTAFHKAVEAEKAASTKGDALYRGLRTYLITQYKTQPGVLDDFGIALQQKQVPDTGTAAVAVAKRAATRAARHTMGPRQKQSVKGTVAVTGTGTPAAAAQPVVTTPRVP